MRRCPVHGILDCSPLLNGCTRLTSVIRHPECIPHCMQGELVGIPEYSCVEACEIALVRERERAASWPSMGEES